MKKYRYFELDEFIRSSVAKKKNIENFPTFEAVDNLNELVVTILDPLRAAYGMPITVSSGYRCEELNRAVKGVSSSVHMKGLACDLVVGGSFNKFKDFVVDWVKKNNIKFDQILIESSGGSKWLHIGLRNNYGQQRGEIKVMNV
ncbi:MAG: peptidase M15 [Bacteroidales bacterium]|nr:peptidase M15 [Bacteroidales bacterium]